MLFSRAWFALMRRNFLYRYRHWLSTLLEMVLPICFVAILIAIKNSLGDDTQSKIIEATLPDSIMDVYRPLSFLDYVTTLTAPRVCTAAQSFDLGPLVEQVFTAEEFDISGMPYGSSDWQNPFVRCDHRLCTESGQDAQPFCEYRILAVAPHVQSNQDAVDRAQAFMDYLELEYPILFDSEKLPFDFEFVRLFENQAQLESYVTSESYGKTMDRPKVAMGVVWDNRNEGNQYSYILRQNSTGVNVPDEGRPGALTTPDTSRILDEFSPNDSSCPIFGGAPFLGTRQGSCTGQYLYNGIITMQKLVGDFILRDSGTNVQVADNGIRFSPFPTKEYEEGGFFADIASTCSTCMDLFCVWISQSVIVLTYTYFSKNSLCLTSHDLGITLFCLSNYFLRLPRKGTSSEGTLENDGRSRI